MPIEMDLWRIEGDRPLPVAATGIGEERRLESIIACNVDMLGLGPLMLLGRQVSTDFGSRIDLLALDADGTLYVIELKRGRTPREVVAQVVDYGSWARRVGAERLAQLFETSPFAQGRTFISAFAEHFGHRPPETINESHRLVIVASELDESTQRIVEYLLEDYGVPINVVFFQYFSDGGSEYLGRSWLRDPQAAEERTRAAEPKRVTAEWNGTDYYVLLEDDVPRWEDAREWGYVYAGGGSRFTLPLFRLEPGARVFVHLRHHGYVGVGRVLAAPVPVGEFIVNDGQQEHALLDVPLRDESLKQHADDPERAAYVVPVRWEWAVSAGEGYWETGFFSLRYRKTLTEMRDLETSQKIRAHAHIPADIPDSEQTTGPETVAGTVSRPS